MIKNVFLTLLTPILFISNFSIDSLKTEMDKVDGLEKVKTLNTLAIKYLSMDEDSALYFAQESFDIANFFECETLSANSAFLLGKAYILKENYVKALKFSKYSMDVFRVNNNTVKYIHSLNDLGAIYSYLSDYNNALKYYKEILSITKNSDYKEEFAAALDGIGTMYYLKGNYDLALTYLDSSLIEYMSLNIQSINSRLFYGIGAVYMSMAQYDHALDYLLKSIILADEKEQIDYIAMSTHAIGVIYEKLKNFSLSLEYSKKALKIAEGINDKYLIGNFLSHLGEIYLQFSKIDTAVSMANRALSIQNEINNKVGIARAYDLLGDIYRKDKQYRKALNNYEKAWEVIENVGQNYRRTKIIHHLGIINKTIGNYDIANEHLYRSLENAQKIGAQDLVQDNLAALSDFYVAQHDYKQAYQYLNQFSHLSDSIFTTNSHNIAAMQMRYETGKREKENDLLKSEINIQNLELEKSILKNWLSTLSLVIVSVIGFFSYHRYNVKKKANVLLEDKIQDALQKQKEQQEIIFHQANLSSLGELSAGMAHEINQPLQGIKLSTEALDLDIRDTYPENPTIKENISEIYQGVDRIKKIIDHVRIFASQQKNHIDEYFSISTVIENALSLVGKQYLKLGIIFQLKLNDKIGQVKGNPYKYEQIVFNLLSNAKDALIEKEMKTKRSQKKEIKIKTYRENTDIVLEIQDNGIGMTQEQKEYIFNPFFTTKNLGEGTGLGLSIVFGIVREMNGKIFVETDYNIGTSILVRLPLVLDKSIKVS